MYKVVIVGKPNVGKSTLFNRLIHEKCAITNDEPGVTRDRLYGEVNWLNNIFTLVDTGGLTIKDAPFQKNIQIQVNYALEEADLILFITSLKEGIDADDHFITKLLKKQKCKNVILVVNKCEKNQYYENEKQFYSLGFGKPYYIASEHGIGTGDLLDAIISKLTNKIKRTRIKKDRLPFCIIGRTNVGKSTLVNAILNEDRVLVSPIAHTTRDSVDCDFSYKNQNFTIIDTAGIRRKGKITNQVEKYAILRTQDAISRSKMILLVLDGSEEFNEQDEVIGGLAYKANIPTIIVVNKWDNIRDKSEKTMNEKIKIIRSKFKYLPWAPIVFISAKNKKRLHLIFDTMQEMHKQLNIKVNTSLLNECILKMQSLVPASMFKGGRLNISYATQVKGQVPTFVIFTNDPKYLHFSYARMIENLIRNSFGIDRVPITVYYKDKNARIRGIREEQNNG